MRSPQLRRSAGLSRDLEIRGREREAFELKARRHGAADERPVAGRPRGLPVTLRHDPLGLALFQIRRQHQVIGRSGICRAERKD